MKRITILLAAMALLVLSGCNGIGPVGGQHSPLWTTNFPYGASWDRHNFLSTPHQPVTLTLKDTVTGETVWTLDVPTNMMAVVDLEHDVDWTPGQTPAMPANVIRWDIIKPGTIVSTLSHTQKLNGNPVLLRYDIRKPVAEAPTAIPEPITTPTPVPAPTAPPMHVQPKPTVTTPTVPVTTPPAQPYQPTAPAPRSPLDATDSPM